jgi:hypothetical protein
MSEKRDTQFAGFADLLFDDLIASDAANEVGADLYWGPKYVKEVQTIFARRAFDLVKHVLGFVPQLLNAEIGPEVTVDEVAGVIPDLTNWPEVTD